MASTGKKSERRELVEIYYLSAHPTLKIANLICHVYGEEALHRLLKLFGGLTLTKREATWPGNYSLGSLLEFCLGEKWADVFSSAGTTCFTLPSYDEWLGAGQDIEAYWKVEHQRKKGSDVDRDRAKRVGALLKVIGF